jgi:hypothetical protein
VARNLVAPPSDASGALGAWLRDLHRWVEAQPAISLASFGATDTPNSRVTGYSGTLCINIGSASTDSRLWVLGGASLSALTDQGWRVVQLTTP